jgi:diguanylate cyclase (GGDEF)-like protein
VAVLFVDLDGFKRINDTYGHTVGDRVLSVVSARLSAFVEDGWMLARLGGDEFVLVVPGIDEAAGQALGETFIDVLRDPITLDGQRLVLGASVGVLVDAGSSALDRLRDADQAMYRAKQLGKGRVEVFTAALARESESRREIERELAAAVDRDELRIHLQPVVALSDGVPWGAEALVRWQHPERGLLAAGAFVPAAEGGPLVLDLDRFVLREACATLARWAKADPGTGFPSFSLAVNVSGRHLTEGRVVADVLEALETSGARADRLQLEITESHLLADLQLAKRELQHLVDLGVTIACDDFGTGFASLTYLRELPVSTMKIDRSFVMGLPEEGELVLVLQSLADLLHLDVVAEGVETVEQLQWLHDRGCDLAQGYHLARPMPVEDAETWLVGRWWATNPSAHPAPVTG